MWEEEEGKKKPEDRIICSAKTFGWLWNVQVALASQVTATDEARQLAVP